MNASKVPEAGNSPQPAEATSDATPEPQPADAPTAKVLDGEVVDDMPEALTPEELAAQWESEGPPPAGGLSNFISSLVAVAIGVAGMAIAVPLGLGNPETPGPGLWPFILCLVMTVFGVFQIFVGRKGGDGEKFQSTSWLTAIGFVTLIAMVFLMPVIGFEIPALLLCFVWMKFLGGESWRSATIYSIITVVAFYAIFVLALRTSVPHLI